MNIIEIDELNYQDYTNLDIVAYSFARGGAMGDPGGIEIIDRDAFSREVESNYYQTVGVLYQRWQGIVLKILI